MPAPSDSPLFATNATYAADGDAWDASATRVDPGPSVRAEGFEPDVLPAEWLNHMIGTHGDWIDYHEEFLGLLETAAADHESRIDTLEAAAAAGGTVFHSMADTIMDTQSDGSAAWKVIDGNAAAPIIEDAVLRIRLRLPNGRTLTSVAVQISTSSSRSGADRWSASVAKRVFGDWSGAGAAPTITALGSPVDDAGTNGRYVISITGLSHVVDNTTGDVYVIVTGPSGGAGTSSDFVAGCRAVYT